MTGADYIAECLAREGVSKVFGQCGHTNLALIDALPKVGIDFVSFRHEQLAAHAADAYFRASHKLAVVLVHLAIVREINDVRLETNDRSPQSLDECIGDL